MATNETQRNPDSIPAADLIQGIKLTPIGHYKEKSLDQQDKEAYKDKYKALDEKCCAYVEKEVAKRHGIDEPLETLDPIKWIDKWAQGWDEPIHPSTRNWLIVFTNGINRDVWRLLSEEERLDLLTSSTDLCDSFGATYPDGKYQPGPVVLVSHLTSLMLMGFKGTAETQGIDPSTIGFKELFSSKKMMTYLQERLCEELLYGTLY